MGTLSEHHKVLTDGVGKCSVPMWCNGLPAGFCDKPAYGNYIPGEEFRNGCGELQRFDGKYNGYVPALACPGHGGPDVPRCGKLVEGSPCQNDAGHDGECDWVPY